MTHPMISFKDLSIVFGDAPQKAFPLIDAGKTREEIQNETGQLVGVAHASFDIKQRELLVLMGLSGSGKSTLLRAINGLNKISRGEVLVWDGQQAVNPTTCSAHNLRQLRRNNIGMVFQQFGLLPWRTVYDNVGFGLELSSIPKRERAARIEQQLKLVGLDAWADKYVHELSGGMQQRVGLARAFATEAPILLMDEPFSALDPLIRNHLQDELLELQEKLHKTIVFVSHDLDEAAKIGNRIAIMEGGHVAQIGTPQDIMENPADDYVASFLSQMNPLNVLRAKDIMRPLLGNDQPTEFIECDTHTGMRDVIKQFQSHSKALTITENGKAVGIITEKDILAHLI
ncbi:choline ABC transporter ATP-binding protein [Flexibacterium corallicola]|uniref:choline ABC transporter ATP-binding protein n=1 Tax=Flexibacterium corallicola TaxID=3037259 RepID=UPI00286F9A18|nr:choline ABC transporter ATP-binding protein [Pseudovibrio sp. M1P-2-3]